MAHIDISFRCDLYGINDHSGHLSRSWIGSMGRYRNQANVALKFACHVDVKVNAQICIHVAWLITSPPNAGCLWTCDVGIVIARQERTFCSEIFSDRPQTGIFPLCAWIRLEWDSIVTSYFAEIALELWKHLKISSSLFEGNERMNLSDSGHRTGLWKRNSKLSYGCSRFALQKKFCDVWNSSVFPALMEMVYGHKYSTRFSPSFRSLSWVSLCTSQAGSWNARGKCLCFQAASCNGLSEFLNGSCGMKSCLNSTVLDISPEFDRS